MNRMLALLAMTGILTGCAAHPPGAQTSLNHALLTSKEWVVEDIDSLGVVGRSHASISFNADGRLSGSSSCNRFFANYALEDNRITVTKAASTRMACTDSLMLQEHRFLNALEAINQIEIDATDTLILSGDKHRIIAR